MDIQRDIYIYILYYRFRGRVFLCKVDIRASSASTPQPTLRCPATAAQPDGELDSDKRIYTYLFRQVPWYKYDGLTRDQLIDLHEPESSDVSYIMNINEREIFVNVQMN